MGKIARFDRFKNQKIFNAFKKNLTLIFEQIKFLKLML